METFEIKPDQEKINITWMIEDGRLLVETYNYEYGGWDEWKFTKKHTQAILYGLLKQDIQGPDDEN